MLRAMSGSERELLSWWVRMWGKRRSTDDVPAAPVENAALGGATEGLAVDAGVAVPQRFSEAIATVQPAPSRDAAPSARSAPEFNGAGRPSKMERAKEAPGSQSSPADIAAEPQTASTAPQAAGASGHTKGPTPEEIRFAVTFTRIVSVLSRSPHYKHYSLSDLEWLVVPPILTGQCAVMEAKVNDRQMPIALALWASVSEEVDKRLSENLTSPAKLRPDEWRSGDILWLVDAVGNANAIQHLLSGVQDGVFRHREAKVRSVGPGAQPTIQRIKFGPSSGAKAGKSRE